MLSAPYCIWLLPFLLFCNLSHKEVVRLQIFTQAGHHQNIQTAMIYIHVTKANILGGRSPVDE
jgi:hypothetical protein